MEIYKYKAIADEEDIIIGILIVEQSHRPTDLLELVDEDVKKFKDWEDKEYRTIIEEIK